MTDPTPRITAELLARYDRPGPRYTSYPTADRFVEAFGDAELKQWKLDRISNAGAHLMGRVTYQEMSSYWPQSDDPYAAPMNDIPKVDSNPDLQFLTSLEIATVHCTLDVNGAKGSLQRTCKFDQEGFPHRLDLVTCML